jgi:hypothetical protein
MDDGEILVGGAIVPRMLDSTLIVVNVVYCCLD